VEQIKQREKVPVFEVITPGAREAVEVTKNGKIGVLATRATVNSGAYGKKIRELRPEFEVREVAAPLLVPLAEEGVVEGKITEEVVKMYLKEFGDFDFDTLVLGCTHYPILKKTMGKILCGGQKIVSSGEGLARELKEFLADERLGEFSGEDKYYFTDVSGNTKMVAERFLGKSLEGKIEKVDLG
jgi:glutamate racemase